MSDNGGAAFPYNEKNHDGSHYFSNEGMSLRDYFAAKALQVIHHPGGHYGEVGLKMVAEQAYRLADAMIAARAKALTEPPTQAPGASA
jgi:hypothetical protein